MTQSGQEDRLQNAHVKEVILGNTCRCGTIQNTHVSISPSFFSIDAACNPLFSPLLLDRDEVVELKNIFIPSCCFPPLDSSESIATFDEPVKENEEDEDVDELEEDGLKKEDDL